MKDQRNVKKRDSSTICLGIVSTWVASQNWRWLRDNLNPRYALLHALTENEKPLENRFQLQSVLFVVN